MYPTGECSMHYYFADYPLLLSTYIFIIPPIAIEIIIYLIAILSVGQCEFIIDLYQCENTVKSKSEKIGVDNYWKMW